jgi:DNA invertase Pin-like site-specific DNA recombinase
MAIEPRKAARCAIYTRKSTEHGLELEFNSLDAQREACEAYIRSQVHEGWRILPQRYDDPAFSGGNLERPALRRVISDIEANRIDVVVVYKIDRLTRSLADFAKLVEVFDAKGISFVAVTQQFNTTTSMGRLTLNVLLSFAQFERELASERVRDKIAASRKKGKWTGGSVPLGYDRRDKKLIINPQEAETVRYIFSRYRELRSFHRLIADLNGRAIITKRRTIKGDRTIGGIPFTVGPLAYLLKSRTYLGEVGHSGAWFASEHPAIIERELFDDVQAVLKNNAVTRRHTRADNQYLLAGLLFDEQRHRMGPSFTTKRGIRYRYYQGARPKLPPGSTKRAATRIAAPDIEKSVLTALRKRFAGMLPDLANGNLVDATVDSIRLDQTSIHIALKAVEQRGWLDQESTIIIARPASAETPRANIDTSACAPSSDPDPVLVQGVARAHAWLRALQIGTYQTVDALAASVRLHPKVVRQALRLAFLAPDITEAIIAGWQPKSLTLSGLHRTAQFCWIEQRRALKFSVNTERLFAGRPQAVEGVESNRGKALLKQT